MNAKIKKQWVAALRSGEYKQTTGALCRTRPNADHSAGHCCLGVLCDLAEKAGVCESKEEGGLRNYDGWWQDLPDSVLRWAKLPHRDPVVANHTLTNLNDREERTFSQIADLIEKHL